MDARTAATRRQIALVALALGVTAGTALSIMGLTPWLLWVAAILGVAVALSAVMPIPLATAGAIVLPLALWVALARVLQPVPVGLDTKATTVLALLGATGVAAAWALRARLPKFGSLSRSTAIAVAPVTAIVLALLVYTELAGARAVTWAMHNDAVWNTVATRLMVIDGGVDTNAHPNPSPATSALMAAATSVGRAAVSAEDLLLHDVLRQAQFWLLAMFATSLLTAFIIAPRARMLGRVGAPFTVAVASLLPMSWFVAGNAMQFGFINGTIALALLLAAWIAWQQARTAPWGALVLLSGSIVALLAAWAPVAVIPMALVAASFADFGRPWWNRLGARGWVGLAIVAGPVPAYAITVTLRDFTQQGDALGGDGGIFAIRPEYLLLTFAATGMAALALAARTRVWRDAGGVIAVVVSSTLALAYLVYQRLDAEFLWGYYLAKFSWLVMTLLLIILAGTALTLIALIDRLRGLLVLASAAFIATVMMLLPPTSTTAVPLAAVAGVGELAGHAETTELLFSLSSLAEKNLVAAYNGAPDDGFVNGWLIQIHTTDGADPIRAFAYVLDGTDPARICEAAEVWGGGVTVHTRAPQIAEQLESCGVVSDVVVAG